jgi:hypothetical protein
MGANHIPKLEQSALSPHCRSAQKHLRFDAYILNCLCANYFFNVDSQKLMGFIFHTKPQRLNFTVCAA